MPGRVVGQIHELDRDVDLLTGRVGVVRQQDVALAQDRLVALDGKTRALVVVGDERVDGDDALARLELDLECHGDVLSASAVSVGWAKARRPLPASETVIGAAPSHPEK